MTAREGARIGSSSPAPLGVLRWRPLQADDLEWVQVLEYQCHQAPWSDGNFRDALQAGYDAWVVECPDAAQGAPAAQTRGVGYAVVMRAPDEAHLLNITVSPDWQGRGIARCLLWRVSVELQRTGAQALLLEVRPSNHAAIALYSGLGLVAIGRRRGYYPGPQGAREDALVLRRMLPLIEPTAQRWLWEDGMEAVDGSAR